MIILSFQQKMLHMPATRRLLSTLCLALEWKQATFSGRWTRRMPFSRLHSDILKIYEDFKLNLVRDAIPMEDKQALVLFFCSMASVRVCQTHPLYT